MIRRYPILTLFTCWLLPALAFAQKPIQPAATQAPDFSNTVFPLTTMKFYGPVIRGEFGTGFCLDPACRFIGTNYHVAIEAKPKKIGGERVVREYLATSVDDEGAVLNLSASGEHPLKFTPARDLAIFELSHALRHHNGAQFTIENLEIGDEVEIYTYPKEGINPFRSLRKFDAKFNGETASGLLVFGYDLSSGKRIRPGASGGIVVESRTQRIVGVLSSIATNGEAIALAVPIQSLVDFVSKVQPCLAQEIFPPTNGIPENSADMLPKFLPPASSHSLEHRHAEPPQVAMLRSNAQQLADSIRNFLAVQTFAWGSGNRPPAAEAAYEVRVADGYQQFRKYPNGKRYQTDVPLADLNRDISTGGDWAGLPQMVGTQLGLKIHQADDAVMDNRRLKVFQYWADREDALPECQFLTIADFELFSIKKVSTNACYGEVWTDEELNILRMSLHLELLGKWRDYQTVVTYGQVHLPDGTLRFVPITVSAQATYNKKLYWCRGRFMNYKVFSIRTRMVAEQSRALQIDSQKP